MALVAELADVLASARYLTVQCAPTVEIDDDGLTLTVAFTREAQETVTDEVALLSLRRGLQRLADLASMRALMARYWLDAQWLENALTDKDKGDGHATRD